MRPSPIGAQVLLRTCLLVALVVPSLFSQRLMLDETRVTLAPMFQRIRFGKSVAQDSLSVRGLSQTSAQFSVSAPLTSSWKLDATVAYGSGSVDGSDASRAARTLTLSGLTDTRVRVTGRPLGEALTVILGVNIPTGRTGLSSREVEALRVIGAPAFRLSVPTLGLGTAGTAGLVYSWRAGAWALGTGLGYEMRGSYAPIEGAIAGVGASTTLDPGDLVRVSFGADRLIGEQRFSMLLASEFFGEDLARSSGAGGGGTNSTFRLGPAVSATAQLGLAVRGFRRLTAYASSRYRSSYRDGAGATVSGSSGTQVDVGIEGVRGGATGLALVGSVVGRLDSGLGASETITTAGILGVTAMLGLAMPAGRVTLQPFIQGSVSSMTTGTLSTTASGMGAGVTMTVRR